MNLSFTDSTIHRLCLAGLLFSALLSGLALYNLSKNVMPTLFILVLLYALFFAAGILYYLLKGRKVAGEVPEPRWVSREVLQIVNLLFYVILIWALYTLTQSTYSKPTAFYVLTALAVTLTGLQIVLRERLTKADETKFLLLQILPIAALVRGSSLLINREVIGPDSLYHYHLIENIQETGYLSGTAFHYFFYPAYHLTQSLGGQLLGFSPGSFDTVNLALALIIVFFAYLIGRELVNGKAGLLCALLLSASTMLTYLVDFNTSKIGGTTLLFIVTYALLKLHGRLDKALLAVFVLASVPLFFWHTELSFVLILLLVSDVLVTLLFKKQSELYRIGLYFLFMAVAFVYWMSTSTNIMLLLLSSLFSFSGSGVVQTIAGSLSPLFCLQTSFAYLGLTLPIFFAVCYGLKALEALNDKTAFLLVAILLIHTTPLVGVVTGSVSSGPGRTLTYASIFLLLAAAIGIYYLFDRRLRTSRLLLPALTVVLFAFAFGSISSYLIGDGNGIFNDQIPAGIVYSTNSDLVTYNFLIRTPFNSLIASDYESTRYTTDPARGFYDLPLRQVRTFQQAYQLSAPGSESQKEFFLLNSPILEKNRWMTTDWGMALADNVSSYDKLYHNGDLTIYYG